MLSDVTILNHKVYHIAVFNDGPYASATVAFAPSVNADNTEGTTGKLNVTWLNIACLVPSSVVSKMTSRSIVFVTRFHGWNGYEKGVVHLVIS